VLKRRERVLIDLHEVLEGRTERPFAAIPVTAAGAWSQKRFWGTGYSAQEALSGCLEKIRDADSASLFAPLPTDDVTERR